MHLNLNLEVTLTKNMFNLYQHLRYNDDKVCHYHDRTIISFFQQKQSNSKINWWLCIAWNANNLVVFEEKIWNISGFVNIWIMGNSPTCNGGRPVVPKPHVMITDCRLTTVFTWENDYLEQYSLRVGSKFLHKLNYYLH